MSEWGRMQDVIHEEMDRQGVEGVDVDALIECIVNVADFFPGILGLRAAPERTLPSVEEMADALRSLESYKALDPRWADVDAKKVLAALRAEAKE